MSGRGCCCCFQGELTLARSLRVKGGIERCFAFGDCASNESNPLPQLAQVAQQQGKYLAGKFNRASSANAAEIDERLREQEGAFRYYSLGSMATLGGFRGVADFSHVGSTAVGAKERNLGTIRGVIAFVIWRSAYLGRQVSWENKITILFYWMRTWIWGRDISRF